MMKFLILTVAMCSVIAVGSVGAEQLDCTQTVLAHAVKNMKVQANPTLCESSSQYTCFFPNGDRMVYQCSTQRVKGSAEAACFCQSKGTRDY